MKISIQALQRAVMGALTLSGLLVTVILFGRVVATGSGSSLAPRVEVWEPATPQTYRVPFSTGRTIGARISSQNLLDITSARYRLYNPSTGLWTTYVPAASLFNPYVAIITATNFPLLGAGEKINFYIQPIGGDISFSPDHNIVATAYSYFPIVASGTNQGNFEPNDDPCQAVAATPGTVYSTLPDDQYDFFSLAVPIQAKVTLTITDFMVAGQLQFRSPIVTACSPTTSTNRIDPYWGSKPPTTTSGILNHYNVSPGLYYARISTAGTISTIPYNFSWSYSQGTNPFEPNNNQCAAAAITPGITNQAYPEDAEDWYWFDIASTLSIQVTITNYSATGQYSLYRQGADCGTLTSLDVKGSGSSPVVLSAASQPAGRYLVRVATTGGANATTLYSFIATATTPLQPWTPNINTCPALPVDNCPPDQTNNTINVYWGGASGATSVRVQMNNMAAVGGCPAGSSAFDQTFAPPTTPSGSWSRGGLNAGYYSLNLYISGPQGTFSRTNMPIKMNCAFLLNAPNLLPTPIGPGLDSTVLPDFSPLPTPIPLPVDLPDMQPTPQP